MENLFYGYVDNILEYGCHEKTELQKWNKKRLSIWVLWYICGDIYDSEEFNKED